MKAGTVIGNISFLGEVVIIFVINFVCVCVCVCVCVRVF